MGDMADYYTDSCFLDDWEDDDYWERPVTYKTCSKCRLGTVDGRRHFCGSDY
jgi:hypothetical protein